jgi:preprotein translocase subunit SecE
MSRVFQFFRDVKAELFKVVWPTRQETIRYTITVIIFSIVIAGILGAADYGLLKLFEKVINR